jgi:hypothetical protein
MGVLQTAGYPLRSLIVPPIQVRSVASFACTRGQACLTDVVGFHFQAFLADATPENFVESCFCLIYSSKHETIPTTPPKLTPIYQTKQLQSTRR